MFTLKKSDLQRLLKLSVERTAKSRAASSFDPKSSSRAGAALDAQGIIGEGAWYAINGGGKIDDSGWETLSDTAPKSAKLANKIAATERAAAAAVAHGSAAAAHGSAADSKISPVKGDMNRDDCIILKNNVKVFVDIKTMVSNTARSGQLHVTYSKESPGAWPIESEDAVQPRIQRGANEIYVYVLMAIRGYNNSREFDQKILVENQIPDSLTVELLGWIDSDSLWATTGGKMLNLQSRYRSNRATWRYVAFPDDLRPWSAWPQFIADCARRGAGLKRSADAAAADSPAAADRHDSAALTASSESETLGGGKRVRV